MIWPPGPLWTCFPSFRLGILPSRWHMQVVWLLKICAVPYWWHVGGFHTSHLSLRPHLACGFLFVWTSLWVLYWEWKGMCVCVTAVPYPPPAETPQPRGLCAPYLAPPQEETVLAFDLGVWFAVFSVNCGFIFFACLSFGMFIFFLLVLPFVNNRRVSLWVRVEMFFSFVSSLFSFHLFWPCRD